MWFHALLASWKSGRPRGPRPARRGTRLTLERLEDRTLLSNYSAASVSDLIADINAANTAGGSNTITLAAPTTSPYALTAVDNSTDGATGLPVIAANDNLTIVCNGDTIERSTAAGTAGFRLFDAAAGASLTLQTLTLQGGLATGAGVSAEGGAIYSQGALTLSGVTVQDNQALGIAGANSLGSLPAPAGGNAFGGGLYVAGGTATLTNGTLSSNTADGGQGGNNISIDGGLGGAGGIGFGGGLAVTGGTVSLTSCTLRANTAQGGNGGHSVKFATEAGKGGNGFGGALQVTAGTVSSTSSTLSSNTAQGGIGGTDGGGYGGGLEIAAGTLTSSTDILSSNVAWSGEGGVDDLVAEGGGLYNAAGAVSLSNDTVESNTAAGPASGYGGGLYNAGGTLTLASDTVESNTAGGPDGYGGGLRLAGGTAALTNCTVQGNSALGPVTNVVDSGGVGGGIDIGAATVYIDSFTVDHTSNNTAAHGAPNIVGKYILRNA